MKYLEKIYREFGWYDGDRLPLKSVMQSWRWRQAYHLMLQPLSIFDNSGYNLLDDTWDYAIVMDACRYDITDGIEIDGKRFEQRLSPASATMEWVSRCVQGQRNDIVLVTANPYLSNIKIRELTSLVKPFYNNIPIWDKGWDNELRTTPPWRMVHHAKKAIKKYPDKRVLFWFMQPHAPFIGFNPDGVDLNHSINKGILEDERMLNIWRAIIEGYVDKKEAYKAYNNNLGIVWKFGVLELMDYLSGEIVITSDHGNSFGEMGVIAHPQRIHISPLVEVPYMKVVK